MLTRKQVKCVIAETKFKCCLSCHFQIGSWYFFAPFQTKKRPPFSAVHTLPFHIAILPPPPPYLSPQIPQQDRAWKPDTCIYAMAKCILWPVHFAKTWENEWFLVISLAQWNWQKGFIGGAGLKRLKKQFESDANKPVSQSCTVAKSGNFWLAHWTFKLGRQNRLLHWPKCSCMSVKIKRWKLFTTSCLYAKFNCPVACQNCSLLATAHDCDTGLSSIDTLGLSAQN